MNTIYARLEPKDFIALASATVALLSLGIALFSAFYTARTFRRMGARDQRDALFKAFDSYLKIRDLRAKATASKIDEDWQEYYRALFDLQWSEYYIWREGALADKPYRVWLEQHYSMFEKDEKPAGAAGYRAAWKSLCDASYFGVGDAFVRHMNAVHRGKINQALIER